MRKGFPYSLGSEKYLSQRRWQWKHDARTRKIKESLDFFCQHERADEPLNNLVNQNPFESIDLMIFINQIFKGDRMGDILILRFWGNMTYEEIGREYGVTRERIRQGELKALRILRHPRWGLKRTQRKEERIRKIKAIIGKYPIDTQQYSWRVVNLKKELAQLEGKILC